MPNPFPFVAGCFLSIVAIGSSTSVCAQISIPDDAPQPLSPAVSASVVSLPDGFSLQLLAAEPLIRNPSGVCWDERGRLFLCELNGYNLEGQYDIEELNKTGELDRDVRRIPAPATAIEKAKREQTGSVKRLIDTDGDGVMDDAEIWADDLPACFGLVPARGGVIVVCAPDIVFLADRDEDGIAEVRETLFTGFRTGVLERRMSAPQWGVDDWIYVSAGGGTITGPHLSKPIELPNNDIRFKSDGSAIEPLAAGTWTFGSAISDTDDHYVISTATPAIYVAPFPWRYLERNPHAGFGRMTVDVGPGNRCYPTSHPHPWRSRRAGDPGFEELYRTRYGASESTPNGFFTSACSPLVYNDTALPLSGQLLACEPAQNLIHRSRITRNGLVPKLVRHANEQQSEFLASTDIWFHPIAMSHAPDGAIVICDFYREIIEDYSAIPRYLQQQYQLKHGEHHGRLWRLVHRDMRDVKSTNMKELGTAKLVDELSSPRFWRRQTAKRLLIERLDDSLVEDLRRITGGQGAPPTVIGALHTLNALGYLTHIELRSAMRHEDPAVVVQALRLADQRFDAQPGLLDEALTLINHRDERVRFQLALSLGETNDGRARLSLAMLAFDSIDVPWMDDAIVSSLEDGCEQFLESLFLQTGTDQPSDALAKFLTRLCEMVADRRDDQALSRALTVVLTGRSSPAQQHACLDGFVSGFSRYRKVELTVQALAALRAAVDNDDPQLATAARSLVIAMKAETETERSDRLMATATRLGDVQLPVDQRIAAAEELAVERDDAAIKLLVASTASSTPSIRTAILELLCADRENRPLLLSSIESGDLPASALSAVQWEGFLSDDDPVIQARATKLLTSRQPFSPAAAADYLTALAVPTDLVNGQAVFKKLCSNCHKVRGIGFEVGPDLNTEFGRSEQTWIQDILAPSAVISPGYATYIVQTVDGAIVTGLISAESPTSVTMRGAEGKEQTVLRKDIERIRASEASLMPEDLTKSLTPKDAADVIGWLRSSGQSPADE